MSSLPRTVAFEPGMCGEAIVSVADVARNGFELGGRVSEPESLVSEIPQLLLKGQAFSLSMDRLAEDVLSYLPVAVQLIAKDELPSVLSMAARIVSDLQHRRAKFQDLKHAWDRTFPLIAFALLAAYTPQGKVSSSESAEPSDAMRRLTWFFGGTAAGVGLVAVGPIVLAATGAVAAVTAPIIAAMAVAPITTGLGGIAVSELLQKWKAADGTLSAKYLPDRLRALDASEKDIHIAERCATASILLEALPSTFSETEQAFQQFSTELRSTLDKRDLANHLERELPAVLHAWKNLREVHKTALVQ